MADLSGFSRSMGTDEESTIDGVQDFHRRARALIEELDGRIVDTAGDSVFAEFDSVVNAVLCAQRIQQAQSEANVATVPAERLLVRIGVHLGDVVVEDYRIYGDGVNIAARLEPLADPGGICISEAVYQQVRTKLEFRVEDLGLRELKNIEHPVRLYKIAPIHPTAEKEARRPSRAIAKPGNQSARRSQSGEILPTTLADDLMRVHVLVPAMVGVGLLVSEPLLFPSAGVLPALGTVLLSVVLGLVWRTRSQRSGSFLLALGFGIAAIAFWTNWSRVTNGLFVLGGLIVAAIGASRRQRLS